MDVTAISQPCIFAVQVALAELWASWGVRPEASGRPQRRRGGGGATWPGVFGLEDAVRVIYDRGPLHGAGTRARPDARRRLSPDGGPRPPRPVWRPRRPGRRERPELGHALGRSRAAGGDRGPARRRAACSAGSCGSGMPSTAPRWTRSATNCSPRWRASGRGRPSCPCSPPSPAGRSTGRSSARNTGGTTSAGRSGSPTGSIA